MKKLFLALVGLTSVKGTSVRKKGPNKEGTIAVNKSIVGPHFDQQSIKIRFKKSPPKRSPQNIKVDTKGVPKWSQNRCQNSSKINAKTSNEKDQENHQKTCFSEE